MTAVRLTLAWVARASGGTLRGGGAEGSVGSEGSGGADREIGHVVIDSRVVQPGDLFVAIRGPRFDGHDFVGDVLERGAAAAIVGRAFMARRAEAGHQGPPYDTGTLIEVGDTLRALQDLAHAVRSESGSRVIAITGSAGKTTTKEAIAAFLAARFSVVRNKGNLNNHIGLPLSLMQLREGPDVAVMELGMNHAGEISTLVAIAAPDVRVWTNVGDAHLGFFASPDAIADAKAEILERAGADTVLVCNADDPRVMARVREFHGRIVTFGASEGAAIRAVEIEDRGLDGVRARLTTPAGDRVVETPLLGLGNLSNVLAAAAVAIDAGVPLDEIVSAAARLRPSDRRGVVHRLREGIVVIDDSYNSSPAALRRALDVVAHERRARRRVAVLGEMLELGAHAARLHEQAGRDAAAAGIDRLFAIGGSAARMLAEAAVTAGLRARDVAYIEQSGDAAAAAVLEAVKPGDLVLVKGSRGVRTDLIADRLVAELT